MLDGSYWVDSPIDTKSIHMFLATISLFSVQNLIVLAEYCHITQILIGTKNLKKIWYRRLLIHSPAFSKWQQTISFLGQLEFLASSATSTSKLIFSVLRVILVVLHLSLRTQLKWDKNKKLWNWKGKNQSIPLT